MRLLIKNALIYDSGSASFFRGNLLCGGGRIISLGNDSDLAAEDGCDVVVHAGGACLVPGLVDIHTHGRAGFDFCDAQVPQLRKMAESYLACGVTTVMPTLASAPFDKLLAAADRINSAREGAGARLTGLHLEGRYLNPQKRGIQSSELLAAPDTGELEKLVFRMRLPFHISLAPELDPDGSFIRRAVQLGATVSAAHTMETYAQARTAETYGVTAYTHLFNAMPPLHHREGGPVCAALTGGAYCELICDGVHIAPETVRLAYRCAGSERLVLVSDSMAGAGAPDGVYTIAGVPVTVKDGRARSEDGTLGGSTLDMLTALNNLTQFCSTGLEAALPCATLNPARAVGIDNEVGSLEPGKRADMLLLRKMTHGYKLMKVISGDQMINI